MNDPRVIEKYNNLLEKYGDSPEALGWLKKRQKLRFKILTDLFNLNSGSSVLDFGCGFGDMYKFLSEKYPELNYHGVDINEKLILTGRQKYPKAKLEQRDVFVDGLDEQYDFIFSSGVHNIRFDNNTKFNEETFKLFYDRSNIGFSINFLSDKVERFSDDSFHSSPAQILELAYRFTNRVVLRNDYMPFEFTVYVFKKDSFSSEFAVYKEFEKYLS